jgi:CRP/FNR family transcriptional regulator, cyclic AMP receptor protein
MLDVPCHKIPAIFIVKVYMPFFDLFRLDANLLEIQNGQALFHKGDAGDAMYVLLEGEAEIYINGVVFEKCTPGTIVGEISVIEHSLRYATVIACTVCKFAVIDRHRFHFLVDETPGFAIAVMRIMAQRLIRCDEFIPVSIPLNVSD